MDGRTATLVPLRSVQYKQESAIVCEGDFAGRPPAQATSIELLGHGHRSPRPEHNDARANISLHAIASETKTAAAGTIIERFRSGAPPDRGGASLLHTKRQARNPAAG